MNLAVNLGGEGEIPGALNQQPPSALGPNWLSATFNNPGKTIRELEAEGHQFLIAPNDQLPFPDGSVDVVYTNWVPLDRITHSGPGVQTSEIKRILKSGGVWIKNGKVEFTKP